MNPRNKAKLLCQLAALFMASSTAMSTQAQVPANIAAGLQKIGPIVDPPCTALLYRSLMPANDAGSSVTPVYPGITISRDVSFGPNKRDIVDIFYADKGAASRPVLIFVAGGAGNKIGQQIKESNAFYDNIMRWAASNGMVGVNMERHPGAEWDDGAKDMSRMIQFLQANIGMYRGDPGRMIIWAHSAGNVPTGIYIGHPELWGSEGVGVKGVIFMSGQFNALPAAGPNATAQSTLADSGKACGLGAGAVFLTTGAIEGPGRAMPSNGPPPAGAPKVDPAIEMSRSSLPGLRKANVKFMLATAELDPGADGKISAFNQALYDELCKDGPARCPTMLYEKGESHMSEVYSIDTPDKTVSGPVLVWIRKTLR
jgi:hypothetical protein